MLQFLYFFAHDTCWESKKKEEKKQECISKNGIPADGGILFFEMPTPKQWRKHSQGNMPFNYTKKLEQVFTNKSKNSKNVKISLSLSIKRFWDLIWDLFFRFSFEISFKTGLAIGSFASSDFCFFRGSMFAVSLARQSSKKFPRLPLRHLAVFSCCSLIYLFNELLNSSFRYLLLYELNKEGCLAARHGGNCSCLPLLRLPGTSGLFFSAARINLGLCLVG